MHTSLSVDTQIKDTAIQGKLVTVSFVVSDSDPYYLAFNPLDMEKWVKEKLAAELAKALIQNNLVEFTKNISSLDFSTKYTAGCYLAPNSQVKLLRTYDLQKGK